jgi:hypothetical protein
MPGLINVDLCECIELSAFEVVMRYLVMPHLDVEVGERHRGSLTGVHESPDAGEVCLKS